VIFLFWRGGGGAFWVMTSVAGTGFACVPGISFVITVSQLPYSNPRCAVQIGVFFRTLGFREV